MVRSLKAQAAVDFMMSYGIALIIIFIAVAVIYKVTVLSPVLAVSSCTAAPGFECEAYVLNVNGILSLQFSQATGGSIVVRGAACSSQPNNTGNKPAFGNIKVANTIAYYPPSNSPGTGLNVFSGGAGTLNMYCYLQPGIAKGALGNGYIGYVWLNYTVPGFGNLTQRIATLNLRYT